MTKTLLVTAKTLLMIAKTLLKTLLMTAKTLLMTAKTLLKPKTKAWYTNLSSIQKVERLIHVQVCHFKLVLAKQSKLFNTLKPPNYNRMRNMNNIDLNRVFNLIKPKQGKKKTIVGIF